MESIVGRSAKRIRRDTKNFRDHPLVSKENIPPACVIDLTSKTVPEDLHRSAAVTPPPNFSHPFGSISGNLQHSTPIGRSFLLPAHLPQLAASTCSASDQAALDALIGSSTSSDPDKSSLSLVQPNVVRRNERERNRVKLLNLGFEQLREVVPAEEGERLSKISTLKKAIWYIQHLDSVLSADSTTSSSGIDLFDSTGSPEYFHEPSFSPPESPSIRGK